MPSLTTRMAGRCACVGVLPPGAAPDLLVDARGLGNEKTQGIPEVTSGQDTKTRHPTTIGAQEAPDPGSLHSAREGRRTRREEVDAQVRVHVREL